MTKENILDDLMILESQLEEEYRLLVQQKVTSKMEEKYGREGRIVSDIYYNGSSNEPAQVENEDYCPTCEKNAKELIDKMQQASVIVDSISDSELNDFYEEVIKNHDCIDSIKTSIDILDRYLNKRFSHINKSTIINLLIKILISNQEIKNDGTRSSNTEG